MKFWLHRTWMTIFCCVLLTGAIAAWVCLAKCYSIEWIERTPSTGWTVYEPWCGPTMRKPGRTRVNNQIRVQKTNENPVTLRSGSNVRFYSLWATNDFVYGVSGIEYGSRGPNDHMALVFRVNGKGTMEVCAETDPSIRFSRVLESGRHGDIEWAVLRTVSEDNGEDPRLGQLALRFDQCVGGSDLVSLNWRIGARLQEIGLRAAPGRAFSGLTPMYKKDNIVFDGETPVAVPGGTS